jgi:hypothetical protein
VEAGVAHPLCIEWQFAGASGVLRILRELPPGCERAISARAPGYLERFDDVQDEERRRPKKPKKSALTARGARRSRCRFGQRDGRLLIMSAIQEQHPAALLHELALGLEGQGFRDFLGLDRAFRVEPDLDQLMRRELRPDLLDDALSDAFRADLDQGFLRVR